MFANSFHVLTTKQDLDAALDRSQKEPVLLFKHSSICPISARAHDELKTLATESSLPIYKVTVQNARAVSDQIEESLGVRHESPQAIVLADGNARFDASHGNVRAHTIQDVLSEVTS